MKTRLLLLMFMICSFANAQALLTAPYATSIAATTANLNCYINLGNTYQVSYQIATSSAGVASASNQGTQNTFAGSYNLVKNLTGLLPNTTYYFRFRALAFGVYTNSAISSFTTLDNKPTVWYGIPSNITSSTATINFTVNPNGSNTTSTVYYGLTASSLTNAIAGGFTASGNTDTPASVSLNGLMPNTEYYYHIQATNSNGTNTSLLGTFTTTTTSPIISAISSSVGTNTATISYTLNANGSNATSTVYTLDGGIISLQVPGFSGTGNSDTSGNVVFSGLTPNTQYFYRVESSNSNGTSYSDLLNFTTNAIVTNQVVAEYSFDNTYNNLLGNSPFTSNTGTSFTTDRHGNTNGAININNTGSNAAIIGLPYGNNNRTISVWAKTNQQNTQINYVFHYGDTSNGNGLAFKPAETLYFANGANNLNLADSNTNAVWVHYVCTYDGTMAKLYKNGVLFNSGVKTFNTQNNSNIFKLGTAETGAVNYFNGAIDDLKIYNYVLSQSEVTSLFSSNTLSGQEFSSRYSQFSLYPNPVNDILNIESTTEIKSVAIYGLLGNKVLESSSNQVNVSSLTKGIYVVQITDASGKAITQKIVKK